MGVQGAIPRRVDGLVDLINPDGWYWSTYNEQKDTYCWMVSCRTSTNLGLGIRLVAFPVDYGYIADATTGSWEVYSIEVPEWCLESSGQKGQWKPVELTSQNDGRHIWHFGSHIGYCGAKNGYWVLYLRFGLFGVLSTIHGILALSLKYKSRNIDTCSRGRSGLKDIPVWRTTYGYE